jgi:hypothetical protein
VKRPHTLHYKHVYEGVSKSFRTGRLERKLQLVQLSATRCNCIAISWVSLVSVPAIILRVASQRVFIVVSVYFFVDSVRKFWIHPLVEKMHKNGWLNCIIMNLLFIYRWRYMKRSQGSTMSQANRCALGNLTSIPGRGVSLRHHIWVPPSLLFNGYRKLLPGV